MRWLSSPSSWWKRTVLRETALYSFTGMLTRPKLMAPLQIARGMSCKIPVWRYLAFSTGGNLRFSHRLDGVLVGPEALEGGGAQGAALGPLAELDSGHEARLYVARALRGLAALERALVGLELVELALDEAQRLVGETRSDLPGVAQHAVLHHPDDQRAQPVAAAALARRPAPDHDVLEADVLHLDPAARAAARVVGAVEPLRDHALDALQPRRLQERRALAALVARRAPIRALELALLEQLAALLVGQGHRRMSVEVEQVEDDVRDRRVLHAAPDGRVRGEVHARLEPLEARPALVVEGHQLAVEDHPAGAELVGKPAQLGVAGGEVREVAPLQVQMAVVGVEQRPDAVPLHLEAVVLLVARQLTRAGEHWLQPLRHWLVARILRRVHPVDHPVVAARLEQRVSALHPLAVKGRDHLVVAELLGLKGAAVPDRHRAGAVVALRDLAVELEVLERVVLGVHRQPVLVGVLGNAARQRPGGEDAVVLEPEVPVQPRGVVLLHDEAAPGLLAGAAARLGRRAQVPLLLVGA